MKSLTGVFVLLVLVAAVAVTGSQAQPLPWTNPVVRICQQTGPIASESVRCRPVVLLAAPAEMERDFGGDIGGDWANDAGGYGADPEWAVQAAKLVFEVAWKAAVTATSVNIVQRALDWAFGGNVSSDLPILAYLDTSIFDPSQ